MKISELILLGGMSAFAVATLIPSLGMPYSAGQTFGPGFVPLNMSVAVIILCALLAWRQLHRSEPDAEEATASPREGRVAVCATVLLITATVFLAHYGSLLLPLGACIFLVSRFLLNRSWLVAFGSTLATIAAIYGIFSLWLKIPLT